MGRRKKEETIIEEKVTGWVDGSMPKPESSLPTAPDPKSKSKDKVIDYDVPFPDEAPKAAEEKPKKENKKVNDGCYPIPNYKGYSFLEALQSIKAPSNYAARKEIAKANGLDNYLGLGKDNKEMLELLLAGKLKMPK